MINLRSLRIVQFKGIADLTVRDLEGVGVRTLGAGSAAESRAAAEAVRYAFTGVAEGAVVPEGAGYAYVEAAFRCGDDAQVSIFRGMDRRGTSQVSLKEDAGMRITSGEADVSARLRDILGMDVAAWAAATFHGDDPTGRDLAALARAAGSGVPQADAGTPPPAVASAGPDVVPDVGPDAVLDVGRDVEAVPDEPGAEAGLAALTEQALRAADAQSRGARMAELAAAIEAGTAELVALGARARRERTDASVAAERVVQDRERVRARLRRVNEYRDLVSKQRIEDERLAASPPPSPAPRRNGRMVEWGLAAAAVGCAVLVGVASWRQLPADSKKVAGLGFVVSVGSYLWVLSRRLEGQRPPMPGDAPRAPAAAAGGAAAGDGSRTSASASWREALRARFADLGDPDDPDLVPSLRARLSALDDEAAPIQARVEALDGVLAAHEVEAGRASRALHRPLHADGEAETGLLADETPESVQARVAAIGDRLHRDGVERDALAAQGADGGGDVDLRDAVLALGDAAGDRDGAARIVDAHAAPGRAPDGDALRSGIERLAATARDALAARRAAAARSVAPASSAMSPAMSPAMSQGTRPAAPPSVPAADGDALTEESAAPWFSAMTLGRFRSVGADTAGLWCAGAADDRVRFEVLDARTRERLSLALRARLGERMLRAASPGDLAHPRMIVIESRSPALGDDAALGRFLAEHAPSASQVLAAAAPPATPRRAGHDDEPGGAPPRPVLPLPGTLPGPRPRKSGGRRS